MNIKTDSVIPFDDTTYFYSDMRKGIKGELHFEDDGNNLVLNFNSTNNTMGFIGYNDGWGENFFQCYSMYFRIPGEHQLDGKTYDMSLQIRCQIVGQSTGTQIAMVEVPVEVAIEGEKQSVFFDQLEDLRTKEIDHKKLPFEITINKWGSLMDGLIVFDDLFHYQGVMNFPPCEDDAYWFFCKKPQKISKELLNQIKGCLNPDTQTDGNNRIVDEMQTDVYLFPH